MKLGKQTLIVYTKVGFLLQKRQIDQFDYDQIRKIEIQEREVYANYTRITYWQFLVQLTEQRSIVLAGANKPEQLLPLVNAIERYRYRRH